MRVLVTGATGFAGERLVPALPAAGHDVTALVRDPGGYDTPPDVDVAQGDLLEAEPGTAPGDALQLGLAPSSGAGRGSSWPSRATSSPPSPRPSRCSP